MYAFVQYMHRSQHDEVLVFSLLNCGGGAEGGQGAAVSSPPPIYTSSLPFKEK